QRRPPLEIAGVYRSDEPVEQPVERCEVLRQLAARAGRERGARQIAVPDPARHLPIAIRLPAPDPDALAFVMHGPAAALGHAVQHPMVLIDRDIADQLQLFREYEEQRFGRGKSLAPEL